MIEVLSPEDAEMLHVAIDAMVDAIDTIFEALKKALDVAVKAISKLYDAISKAVSPKYFNLAYHAKTKRARKKNQKRLWCEINRLLR